MKLHENDIPRYSIGEVAEKFNLSVQMLRKYEAEGLLIIEKSEGNQRRYSPSDIERIKCIRHAINEDKISIAGIQHLQAMIPCWEIKKCSVQERNSCPAFTQHSRGCWTVKHTNNTCAKSECRMCEVYKLSTQCNFIKERIANLSR